MSTTLVDNGIERLGRLTPILGFSPDEARNITGIFRAVSAGWGALPCGGRPRFPSDICDDCSPFEFSVAFEDAAPELRILAEVQAPRPTMSENWRAALAFTEKLATVFGLSLDRLHAISDLFAPTFVTPRFCLWHAFCFRPGAPVDVKVYLNPSARGPALARRVAIEALSRLGFAGAGRFLPPESASVKTLYFGLDLPPFTPGARRAPSSSPPPCVLPAAPRVKVYTAYHEADPHEIEAGLRVARGHVPGQVASFCEAMRGPAPHRERAESRPVQTCLSFTDPSAPPTSGTVYFPIRAHANTDLEVRARVLSLMEAETQDNRSPTTSGDRSPASLYMRVLEAFAERPLSGGVGMCSYVSLRQAPGPRRLTVYLAPEIYAVAGRERAADIPSGVVPKGSLISPPPSLGRLLAASGGRPLAASGDGARARSRGW